eukprot:5816441-Prymnesium_polylepis.1
MVVESHLQSDVWVRWATVVASKEVRAGEGVARAEEAHGHGMVGHHRGGRAAWLAAVCGHQQQSQEAQSAGTEHCEWGRSSRDRTRGNAAVHRAESYSGCRRQRSRTPFDH